MQILAFTLTALAAQSVNAYVQYWNHDSDPTETLRRLGRRADTCPSENPVSCSAVDSQLPSTFCCSQDTTCISIAQSTAAICCPKGSNCENIGTINCDVSLQDSTKNTGPIFTTNLNGQLPSCGTECCPFGYTCGSSNNKPVCVLDKSKAGPASTTRVTSTTSATVTSTPTSLASGIDSKNPPPSKEASNFPAGVFFAGFFPGIVVGVLATLAWVVFTKRNNKPADNRGINISGTHGERPFISAPIKDLRHSNERSDFLGRTRTRARSMFSAHRRSRTMDSVDMFAPKIPTPPTHNNVPVNYINDMPDVPVTPARRVARYHSDESLRVSRDPSMVYNGEKSLDYSPVSPENQAEVSDLTRPETIRVYSPYTSQTQRAQENAPPMPTMPLASVPPLRGMNTRRVSPPYGSAEPPIPKHLRKDSGTAMGTGFGSPFQTPEKKPTIVSNTTPSMYATYHDATTLDSPDDEAQTQYQTLTPARYNPTSQPKRQDLGLHPSAAAAAATKTLSNAQRSLPSQQPKQQQQQQIQKPIIPPRPTRPDTTYSTADARDFDFDEGLDSPTGRTPHHGVGGGANPGATFDSLLATDNDKSRKDKHATNATTFTTMLRNVGFPDPGNQIPQIPQVPKLSGSKKAGGKGMKGMI